MAISTVIAMAASRNSTARKPRANAAGQKTYVPAGFRSAQQAFVHVARFAPSILPSSEALALLYFAERTLSWKKESDSSSYSQMEKGIYSNSQQRWIRGGSGLSKATHARANKSLEQKGLITRVKHTSQITGNQPTEYTLNLSAFNSLIQSHYPGFDNSLVSYAIDPLSRSETYNTDIYNAEVQGGETEDDDEDW